MGSFIIPNNTRIQRFLKRDVNSSSRQNDNIQANG
jgi:hypothetical protein